MEVAAAIALIKKCIPPHLMVVPIALRLSHTSLRNLTMSIRKNILIAKDIVVDTLGHVIRARRKASYLGAVVHSFCVLFRTGWIDVHSLILLSFVSFIVLCFVISVDIESRYGLGIDLV
jgi:hypothetical protein